MYTDGMLFLLCGTLNTLNKAKSFQFLHLLRASNKNFACAGQLIVTMLIQGVKAPTKAITRLPL